MDDLQTDLKSLYDEYATKYRNVVYLEQLLEGEKKNLPQAEEILVNHSVEDRNDLNLDDPGLEVLFYNIQTIVFRFLLIHFLILF